MKGKKNQRRTKEEVNFIIKRMGMRVNVNINEYCA